MTGTGQASAIDAIVALELALLDPDTRRSRDFLARHLADNFEEIAANGRRFGKDEVLARLPQERGVAFQAEAFKCRMLAPGLALLNYDACHICGDQETRSRRTSLWRNDDGVWRMCFHQGTPLASA